MNSKAELIISKLELIKNIREQISELEKDLYPLLLRYFKVFHLNKVEHGQRNEDWFIKGKTYDLDHILVYMTWNEDDEYPSEEEYYFNMPYEYWNDPSLLDLEESKFLKEEAEELRKKEEAKLLEQDRKAKLKEAEELTEYKRLQAKFGP